MKPFLPVLLAWIALLAAPLRAEAPVAPAFSTFSHAGIGTGGPDQARNDALMERVARHVELNLRLGGVARGHHPASDKPLALQPALHAGLRGAEDALLLLFVAGATTNQAHGVIDPTNRVAVINLDALRHPDAETEGRRAEKQAMRGICFLYKLPSCPNPRCSLFPYRNQAELDTISRNPCPPCGMRFQQAAVAAGLRLKPLVPPEELRRKLLERRQQAAATNATGRATSPGP